MRGTQPDTALDVTEKGCRPLQVIRRLLCQEATDDGALPELLAQLAEAFEAQAAGLIRWPSAELCLQSSPQSSVQDEIGVFSGRAPRFLLEDPALFVRASRAINAVTVPLPQGGSALLSAADGPTFGNDQERTSADGWAMWVLDRRRDCWTDAHAADLTVALMGLTRVAANRKPGVNDRRWASQLDRLVKQRRLEQSAEVARRLAHDFGNALTGILGFSELAMAQPLPAQAPLHNFLQEIHRSAEAAAKYTNQLRLFSRCRSAAHTPSQLAEVLQAEIERLKASASGGRPLEIHADVPAELPPLAVEPDLLRSLLAALLENACEAIHATGSDVSSPAPITVCARAAVLDEADCLDFYGSLRPGPHVQVVVSDKGLGLSPEAQRRLFLEPFFSSRSRRRGFGLAAVFGIVCAHQGGVDVRSGSDGGVEARIVLPVSPATEPGSILAQASAINVAAKENPTPAPRSSRRVAGDGERILVVDDDPMILQFVGRTLERAGYRVQTVATGDAALDAYYHSDNDPFRLVLTDVLMPGLGGVELAHRLLNRDPTVRIVFMSGQVSLEIVQRSLRDTSFEVLHKPFRPEGLLRAVRTAVDRPPTAARNKSPALANEIIATLAEPAALVLPIESEPRPRAAGVSVTAQKEGECEP